MTYLCPVCKACKKSDLIITDGDCGGTNCGPGNSFKDFVAKDHDTKTLLDEFAKAAMIRWMIGSGDAKTIDSGGAFDWAKQAGECYSFAAAMMKERARRDETGNIKEATE